MKPQIKTLMVAPLIFGLTGCSTCQHAKTHAGVEVCLPYCEPIVRYTGHTFKVGEAELPIPAIGTNVRIKGLEWDTKQLQAAIPAVQLMDNQRVALCERLNTDIQILRYDDYRRLRFQMEDIQEKMNQLALLVTLNDPKGVEKWV